MSHIPTEQTALIFKEFNKPYELGTRPVPKPSPTEVLVKVEATGLNPIDWKTQKYDLQERFGFKYPCVTGMDGAGFVVEVGNEVSGVEVGDRVAFQGWYGETGTMQEYLTRPGHLIAKIPDSMSFAEASTIPLCLTTAAFGLHCPYDHLQSGGAGLKPYWEEGGKDAYKGTPILVIGGSSCVGQFVIQIAAYQGFSPIITTSSLKHTDYLLNLGADHVVDRYADLNTEIQKYFPGITIPYIYDAVNMPIPDEEVEVLAPGGTLICILPITNTLNLAGDKKAVSAFASTRIFEDIGRGLYASMPEFIAKGIIKPSRVIKVDGGLAGINAALVRLENNEISGHKFVVLPPETGRS